MFFNVPGIFQKLDIEPLPVEYSTIYLYSISVEHWKEY